MFHLQHLPRLFLLFPQVGKVSSVLLTAIVFPLCTLMASFFCLYLMRFFTIIAFLIASLQHFLRQVKSQVFFSPYFFPCFYSRRVLISCCVLVSIMFHYYHCLCWAPICYFLHLLFSHLIVLLRFIISSCLFPNALSSHSPASYCYIITSSFTSLHSSLKQRQHSLVSS